MQYLAPIAKLHVRHPGVTEHICGAFAEAVAVCLGRHHAPPSDLTAWIGDRVVMLRMDWLQPTTRLRDAWANDIDTTELAAYGVALAVLETEMGLVAISRARTLTGADYYVAPSGMPDYFENARKLEVSGLDRGGISEIRMRLRAKLKQVTSFGHPAQALACVVGFGALTVLVREA